MNLSTNGVIVKSTTLTSIYILYVQIIPNELIVMATAPCNRPVTNGSLVLLTQVIELLSKL